MTTAVTLTGFLDDEIVSEEAGTRARFRVCVSPTDDRVDELALPCTVADPEVARVVLSELEPGDRIHVTGYLGLPRIAGHPMWLHVATLELLDTPQPDTDTDDQDEQDVDGTAADDAPAVSSALSDVGRLERYGPYIVWSDPDRCADTVWTETGELLGTAVYPDTASTLIHTHQRRAATGDA